MVKTFSFLVEDDTYYFDHLAVAKVIDFIERFCRLSEPYGAPFILLPWQRQIINDIFGWKRRDNDERRFSSVYIEVPRKQGKTYFTAAILIYLLIADGVMTAEIYAAACKKEQSEILYKSVRRMVDQSQFLTDRMKPTRYKGEYVYGKADNLLKALSGESKGSHGKFASAVALDELHEWTDPNSEALYEALTSSFGNRKSPLVLMITTAGFGGDVSLCKRMHDKAVKFSENQLDDETFYGVIYGATVDDDWTSEETWRKANPSFDLAIKNLRREFQKAKSDTSEENKFKRLYLNIWTQQKTRALNLSEYDLVVNPELKREDFKGKDVILGLDLGEVYDLTAIARIYPGEKWSAFADCYMPSKRVTQHTKADNVPYEDWVKHKYMVATDGVSKGLSVDYARTIADILEIAKTHNVLAVGYDKTNAQTVVPYLEEAGIHCFNISSHWNEMSPATKELLRRIHTGEIEIEDNPCLRWQAGNLEIEHNTQGQIRPEKPNKKGSYAGSAKYKIDGIVALTIATQATMLMQAVRQEKPKDKVSVFWV